MLTAEVEIFNLAISGPAVGLNASIDSENENSREAELCRLHFPQVRDKVLRAAPWSCAKAVKRLQVLAARNDGAVWTDGDPEPGWSYAYKLPSDYITARYLSTYQRFVLGRCADQNALMANEQQSILIYTKREVNVAIWDQGLVDAVTNGLAAMVCLALHGKPDRAQLALNLANQAILLAREQTANEDNQPLETMPDWLVARGASGPSYPNRFIYPVGPLLASSGLNV